MGAFVVYVIKSALCLALLYLTYALLLRGEKSFRLNRVVLYAVLFASFLLPLVQEEWFGGTCMSLQSAVPEGGYAVFIERMEQSGAMSVPQLTAEEESAPVWPMALVALYFAGVALCLAIRSYQLVRLRMTIARGCLWTERLEGSITLYCHARSIPPFSWMRSVVMSETDWDSEAGPTIFAHEKAHVIYGHSWDTMLMLAAEALQWFNPVVWMMEMDMRCVHEYQVDDYVLHQGVNARDYQLYLIKKAVGSRLQSFANGLTQSTLKRRITMMTHKKSSKWAALKYMSLLPVGAFATVAFARPEIAGQMDRQLKQLSAVTIAHPSAPVAPEKSSSVQPDYQAKEPQAEAAGENIAKATQAKPDEGSGNTASDVPLRNDLKKVVVMSYRNHEQSDKTEYNASFTVKEKEAEERQVALDSARFYLQLEEAKAKSGGVYVRVEEMPCYPDGEEELMKFLVKNIRYPEVCRDASFQGMVYCQFVVQADGAIDANGIKTFTTQVTDVVSPVRMALARQLEAEAARVVKEMPRWTPGKRNGDPVDAVYTLPVEFRLK